jgi:4'-phosphopantetheinyl transferase
MGELLGGWALGADEVHVWKIALEQPVEVRRKLALTLSAAEMERAGRFYFERHRHHFVVARGFMRAILAGYLDIAPAAVCFTLGAHGKPALAGHGRDLRFNLSHTGELALLAVTLGRDVGVDIEQVRSLDDAATIAARFFSAAENRAWLAVPDAQKPVAFFNAWTRKEAFIKALGDGLSYPLDRFDVSLAPGEPARLLRVAGDPEATRRWRIEALEPAAGYAAAVAVAGHDWRLVHFKELDTGGDLGIWG